MSADVAVPTLQATDAKRRRPFLFGAIHLGLIYAMGYFLIVAAAPAVGLVAFALAYGGPWWGVAAAFAAVPLEILWYVALLVAVKRLYLDGRDDPQTGSFSFSDLLAHERMIRDSV